MILELHCVEKVVWYHKNNVPVATWTCSENDCESCKSADNTCNLLTLIVSTQGDAPTLPSKSDCRYGNTVVLDGTGTDFYVYEIAIIGRQGDHHYQFDEFFSNVKTFKLIIFRVVNSDVTC